MRFLGGLETAAVALCLDEGGGDVDVFPLRLNGCHGSETAEKHVIRRAAFCGPFGDGHVLALLGAGALGIAELFGIGEPASLAELVIDQ